MHGELHQCDGGDWLSQSGFSIENVVNMGSPFPYSFPIVFADDGNIGGYDFLDTSAVGLGWLMRAREGRLTEAVYMTNQGTGTAAVYLVSFSTDAVSVSEDGGYPLRAIPGWNLENGYYAGVWDGQLQVTPDVIVDARSVPENILQFIDVLYLYTPPDPVTDLWTSLADAA